MSSLSEAISFTALCGESFLLGTKTCPVTCQYLVIDAVWNCLGICIKGEDCASFNPLLRYADQTSLVCRPCSVVGCSECHRSSDLENSEAKVDYEAEVDSSSNICTKCLNGFQLSSDGMQCSVFSDKLSFVISLILLVVIFIFFLYLFYFLNKHKPPPNIEVYKLALRHQSFSKFRDRTIKGNPPYSLFTDLSSVNIGGIGIMLYFRFIHLVGYASMVACAFLGFYCIFSGVSVARINYDFFSVSPISHTQKSFLNLFSHFFSHESLNQNINLRTNTENTFFQHMSSSIKQNRQLESPNNKSHEIDELKKICAKTYGLSKGLMSTAAEKSLLISLLSSSTDVLLRYKLESSVYTWLIYFIVILLTLYHSFNSRQFTLSSDVHCDTMADFSILASNIPTSVVEEYEIRNYIEKILKFNIVGVSILYDYGDLVGEIRRLGEQQIEWADLVKGMLHKGVTYLSEGRIAKRKSFLYKVEDTFGRRRTHFTINNVTGSIDRFEAINYLESLKGSGYAIIVFNKQEDVKNAIAIFNEIKRKADFKKLGKKDYSCYCSTGFRSLKEEEDDDDESIELNYGNSYREQNNFELLKMRNLELVQKRAVASYENEEESFSKRSENINNSVDVSDCESVTSFRVRCMRDSYEDRAIPLVLSEENIKASLFRKKYALKMKQLEVEPTDILYENFSLSNAERWMRGTIAISTLVLLLFLWSLISYAPYTLYAASFAAGTKGPGTLQNLLLGGFVGIGNVLLAEIVQVLAKWVRFTRVEFHDVFVFVSTFIFLQLNVIFNILIAYMVNERKQLQFIWNFHRSFLIKDSYVQIDLIRSIGQEILFVKAFISYVIPGVLFFPPIFSVVTMYILPQIINSFTVMYSPDTSIRTAEKKIECPGCNLPIKYSELLVSFTTCTFLLYFICDIKLILLTLFCLYLSCLLINYRDRYLFLRMTKQSYCTTPDLDIAVLRAWGFSTALLAISPFYWLWRADVISFWCIPVAMIIHFIGYDILCFTCVRALVPWYDDLSTSNYHDVARRFPFNWFNTNPAYVLKKFYMQNNFYESESTSNEPLNFDFKEAKALKVQKNEIYQYSICFEIGKEYLQGPQFAEYIEHRDEAKELFNNVTRKLLRSKSIASF